LTSDNAPVGEAEDMIVRGDRMLIEPMLRTRSVMVLESEYAPRGAPTFPVRPTPDTRPD